jgi:hypothetical protein
MGEVLVEFSEPIAADGVTYVARACGAEIENGHWEGWVEFVPIDGGEVIRSARETTQPNRTDTVYWATGLTPVYLEGSLERALTPVVHHPARMSSVLNPFSAARNGEVMLRRQLSALSPRHLINILLAHDLTAQSQQELQLLGAAELVELIVASVRAEIEEPTAQ